MRGTPEGRYFAGKTALHYAVGESENAFRQAKQQNGLTARETWLKGYLFSEIDKQLSNITSVLAKALSPKNYYTPDNHYIWPGSEGAGVDNLSAAISTFNLGDVLSDYDNEPTVNNSQLYVALRVTEEYVNERIATPKAIQALRRDVREATKDEEPKYKLELDLLRQGVVFFREKVESILTQEERTRAERALENKATILSH